MNLRAQLNKLARWAGIVGWLSIIGCSISAVALLLASVSGSFAYVIAAIPTIVLGVILGVKLINVRKHALNITLGVEENVDPEMNGMVSELALYFKIQGILNIIGIILGVLALLIAIIVLFTTGMSLVNYMEF